MPTGNQKIPEKTIHAVFKTPLNVIWHTVGPKISDSLKARKIRYYAINTARFISHDEDGQTTRGPVVIWIADLPNSTTPEDAHFATRNILALLEDNGVHDVVIEWTEGVVERLDGPPLRHIIDPTYHVRRFMPAGLGMPITTAERKDTDAQGSVAFFFHENKDKCGNASAKVFAFSNCHVLRKDTAVPYQYEGTGAPPQQVRLAGDGLKEAIA